MNGQGKGGERELSEGMHGKKARIEGNFRSSMKA